MLHLLASLDDLFQPFNLLRYITFRTGGATLTALLISFWIGPGVIRWLKSKQPAGQVFRAEGPDHAKKKMTPTMGGVMVLIALGVSTLLWADITNPYVWIVLLLTLGSGAVGFWDDYLKLTKRNPRGLSSRWKLIFQVFLAAAAATAILYAMAPPLGTGLALPFFKDLLIELGFLAVPFAICVIVGAANAVNFTDGLDGLATGPVMIAAGSFGFIAYMVGSQNFAEHLLIHHVPGTAELAVFCGALVGACLGFLWFNAPPAQVFMGDTGSLAMGGALGAVAVCTKHEIVLAIIGGLFVLEAVSVMIQVASFKLTGKRVFLMAPLHHHFERKGWAEPTIVIRFWIISIIMALVGLATLKLR